ncbi:hypothetical protein, partial [Mesomycoplasma ovipneumoniae]|uniref:hypothetical protein n=1 Tax=Mesomycoplasma ovipneumoniae TaxID=29562 RepID=UPI001C52CA99
MSQSILEDKEAEALSVVGRLISRSATKGSISLLVVNGYLAETVTGRLDAEFDKIISQSEQDFAEDFEALVKGARVQVESLVQEDTLGLIKERVDQLTRQSSTIRNLLGSISERTLSPRAIREAVQSASQSSSYGADFSSTAFRQGLGPVEDLFLDSLYRLGKLCAVADRLIDSFFADSSNKRSYSVRRKSLSPRPLRV